MSNVVKIHLPAGHVRVLKKESRERKKTSIPLVEEVASSETTLTGEELETDAATEQPLLMEPFPVDDIEQQLKDEFKAGFDEGRRYTEKTLRDELHAQLEEVRQNADAFM
ncbi:MAG: hypothetical protein HY961_19950, partial [Ignavibacteriae bacterium]|nr:hypothetical protein [Ignavibacteriota bacterium]